MIARNLFVSMISDPPRRILVVTDDACNGGTAHLARQLAVALSPSFGICFASKLATHPSPAIDKMGAIGVDLQDYDVRHDNISQQAFGIESARTLLAKAHADIVLCVDATVVSLLAIKKECVSAGLPFATIVNSVPATMHRQIDLHRSQAETAYNAAGAIVFVSRDQSARWNALFPNVPSRKLVMTNFCDDEFFQSKDIERRRELRGVFGALESDLVCLAPARIAADKGQLISLQALRLAVDRMPSASIRLVFAGEGSERELARLRGAVKDLGLQDRVTYLGSRNDIPDLMDASDCLVLASSNEGTPLSVIEAMAKGLPVIASRVGDIADVVDPSCGLLIAPPHEGDDGTIKELADALIQFAEDRSRLADYSRQARSRARKLFNASDAAEKYAMLFRDMATHRTMRPEQGRAAAAPPLSLWQSADFGDPATAWHILLDGWSDSEPKGVWSLGPVSKLRLAIDSLGSHVTLRFLVKPLIHANWRRQLSEIYHNGRRVAVWETTRSGSRTMDVDLPLSANSEPIELTFLHRTPASGYDLGINDDERPLSFFVKQVFVVPTTQTLAQRLRYRALRAGLAQL